MSNTDDIRQIAFNRIKDDDFDVDYIDDEIVFHTDIRELPIDKDSPVQTDMLTIVVCSRGKLSVELNAVEYTIRRNEVLVCLPNSVINNCMISPDFDGAVLCMSQRGILEQIPENDMLSKALYFAKNPIICVNEDDLHIIDLYGTLIMSKVRMKRKPYYKESIVSIVKAALYDLLAYVDGKPDYCGHGMVRQREVLFKKFLELLSTTRIKPRNTSWYAARLCVTPKYLSTVCKQVSGKTAHAWINEFVSIDIRYWLKSTNKSVKEIADMLEFPSISFFGKYCRAHFGISPTKYRKQLRNIPAGNDRQSK